MSQFINSNATLVLIESVPIVYNLAGKLFIRTYYGHTPMVKEGIFDQYLNATLGLCFDGMDINDCLLPSLIERTPIHAGYLRGLLSVTVWEYYVDSEPEEGFGCKSSYSNTWVLSH